MELKSTSFGTMPEGQEVLLTTITNSNGLTIQTINLGAALASVRMADKYGEIGEITLGFNNLNDYLNKRYFFGVTAGRFANRIGGGQFQVNGKDYSVAQNNGKNHLHGGIKGLDLRYWDQTIFKEPGKISIAYSYLSADGEEGYPGNLAISSIYTLTDEDELVMEYFAETDKPTPVNLTNHTYWNLNGPGSDILGHVLQLDCPEILEVDSGLIPTGKILPVTGTPFDFTSPKTIGKDFAELDFGYDHCLVVKESGVKDPFRRFGSVIDPASGRGMEMFTTQPGVQFYTGNNLDGVIGREGIAYNPQAAFCLETQNYPDAVNVQDFPDSILTSEEPYRQKALHRFYIEQ